MPELKNRDSTNGIQPATVLLVDDEPLNIDLLEQELSGLGLEIHTAVNGRAALDSVAASPPDMIFLDLMMPVLDGFGVLEGLQAHEACLRHVALNTIGGVHLDFRGEF